MQRTLADILADVGASVDQDTALPDGTELTVRMQFGDISQQDWADFYDWKALRQTFSPTILASMTSIGLPDNFDHLSSPVWDYSTGVDTPTKYLEITPADRFRKLSSEKYVVIGGNDVMGKFLQINPALGSGASIVFDFQSTPSSLATTSAIVTAPRNFMAKRIEYYILRSRSDARFPTAKEESEEMLDTAIEAEDTPSGGENNRVPDYWRSNNYRIGT